MAATIELPFEIGTTFWLADAGPRAVMVPCPVCAGKREVTLILGDGEHVRVPCEACGWGYDGPRGVIQEYDHTPTAKPFTVARLVSMYWDGDYIIADELDNTTNFSYCYATEAEALAEAERRAEKAREEQYDRRQRQRRADGSRYAWSVRYHRERIQNADANWRGTTAKSRPTGARVNSVSGPAGEGAATMTNKGKQVESARGYVLHEWAGPSVDDGSMKKFSVSPRSAFTRKAFDTIEDAQAYMRSAPTLRRITAEVEAYLPAVEGEQPDDDQIDEWARFHLLGGSLHNSNPLSAHHPDWHDVNHIRIEEVRN